MPHPESNSGVPLIPAIDLASYLFLPGWSILPDAGLDFFLRKKVSWLFAHTFSRSFRVRTQLYLLHLFFLLVLHES